jgi:AraC family transcriptional regulator
MLHYLGPRDAPPRSFDWPALGPRQAALEVYPPDAVKRRAVRGEGIAAEIVQATRRERLEFRFCARVHLLGVCDQGVRSAGETFVEGLPRSILRDTRRKLTFVPAGHQYRELHEPGALPRAIYFYVDPAMMPVPPHATGGQVPLAPRLFFEDAALSDTAFKLMRLIESPRADGGAYFEALGVVLAHELLRLNAGTRRAEAAARGGLASWQQRAVISHIEEHLAEQIPLARLAELVHLSRHYFCRAFKQTFGMPPHRYHNNRRVEYAKSLLAVPAVSVTEIGLTVGFGETSSFTSAFRRTTGLTPTAYRRNLL